MTETPTVAQALRLLDALVRAETTAWNALHARLRDAGAEPLRTVHTLRLLSTLGGEARVEDLSRGLAITIGAASKVVDRLVDAGLAARRPHPGDGRSSLVAATPAGLVACEAGTAIVAEGMRDWTSGVAGTLDDVIAALEHVTTAAGERVTP